MNAVALPQVVLWLRAAGEPTRLRLLALCAGGALTVSDLAQAVRQSEPRVSRHLKILCGAGLLARTREGQFVSYGMADDARAVGFVRGLLLQLDGLFTPDEFKQALEMAQAGARKVYGLQREALLRRYFEGTTAETTAEEVSE